MINAAGEALSSTTRNIHKIYEYFLNSYKAFVVTSSRLHRAASIYVVVQTMAGVQDYYAKDSKGALQ
jgi:hypothetical protein